MPMTLWENILYTLGGSAVVSAALFAALIFFGRNWWLARINESVKNIYEKERIQIKKDNDIEIARFQAELEGKLEGIKNGYQIAAQESQIRFSKLHEERARAIKAVYGSLAKAFYLVTPIADPHKQWGFDFSSMDSTDASEFYKALETARRDFGANKFLLPKELSLQAEFLFMKAGSMIDMHRMTMEESQEKARNVYLNGLLKLMRLSLEDLEDAMRELLDGSYKDDEFWKKRFEQSKAVSSSMGTIEKISTASLAITPHVETDNQNTDGK